MNLEKPLPVREVIISAHNAEGAATGPDGVEILTFVSEMCGASSFSTGIARFESGAYLPYHAHKFSEAVTVVEGIAIISIEGREYRLHPKDCAHLPSGIAHQVANESAHEPLIAHWSFASAKPTREPVNRTFSIVARGDANPAPSDPETIVRYRTEAVYELSKSAFFLDLFARRYGAEGICGGHGRFLPGASLPCHTHDFDESITIVAGRATCLVQGRRYELSGCDTAFIPKGLPHRFLNLSHEEMSMIWVYAGSEPDRRVVDSQYCSGELAWPGTE